MGARAAYVIIFPPYEDEVDNLKSEDIKTWQEF